MQNTVVLGRKGEALVLQKYLEQGYVLITQNFQYYQSGTQGRQGEIDLILSKSNLIVLVEVKTRSNLAFGAISGQIGRKQLLNLQRAFEFFLIKFPAYRKLNARFDVATVLNGQIQIIENAYWF